MYRTRKRARDEVVTSSVQLSRAESSRVRDDGAASSVQKFRVESSRVRDDGAASSVRKFQAESSRARDDGAASSVRKFQAESSKVRDDGVASSIRKLRGETSRGQQLAHSSFRDDDEEVYRRQDIHSTAVNDKVYSTILESIKSILPEGETSQRSAYDKAPAHPSNGGGIFWKDKSDLDAFRAHADMPQASRGQEVDGELNSTEALHQRLARLEQLLSSSRTAPVMKQQEDHHNDSLARLLGLSSDARNIRLGQGNTEGVHRPANISRVLEELDSQVQASYSPRSHRNFETEMVAPRSSFHIDRSREFVNRDNVALSSQHVKSRGMHGRTDSQMQSSPRAPSRGNLESQFSSRPANSLSVIDALQVLLSGNITGNGRGGNIHEDTYHLDSQFAASPRAQSQGNLEPRISSPSPSPLAMEDYSEKIMTGNITRSSKQAKIHDVQTRGESRVRAKQRSQSRISSFQPNSLPTEDFLEESATVKSKRAKIRKAQSQVGSQLQRSRHAQPHENSEPRISAAPLSTLPMEDSPEMLRTDLPIQMLDPAQSHGDSDSRISLPVRSPKPRGESPEMLVTGYVMENSKHGKIRKAKCQPLSQVQDTLPLSSLPLEDSLEVRKKGRKVRGCTRLDEVWNMPEGERIICDFNELCQPLKAEGRLLTRFIGTVVRKSNLAPLDIKDWHRMPKQNKEEMWKIVESKFLIPAERKEEIKAWIIADLADKWRNYKCVLRSKYFDGSKPLTELAKLCPPSVDKDQWIGLLNLWNSPKWKKISEVNKKNRENHKISHTSGTNSYAMVEAEMKEENGVSPTHAQVFAKTHRHKDGTDVNEDTAKAIEEFENFGTRDTEADEVGNNWEDDTHSQYRGLGLGKLGRRYGKRKGWSLWNRGRHN